jgi:hypothetical protein
MNGIRGKKDKAQYSSAAAAAAAAVAAEEEEAVQVQL